jgi:hypothetical protein
LKQVIERDKKYNPLFFDAKNQILRNCNICSTKHKKIFFEIFIINHNAHFSDLFNAKIKPTLFSKFWVDASMCVRPVRQQSNK